MTMRFLEMQHFGAHVPACQENMLSPSSRYNAGSSVQKIEPIITSETSIRHYQNTRLDIPKVIVYGPVLWVFYSPCVPHATPISSVSNCSPYWYLRLRVREFSLHDVSPPFYYVISFGPK